MVKEKLTGIILQHEIIWEDPEGNRHAYDQLINELVEYPDLIVLPEMCTTGFSMDGDRLAETESGPTMDWLLAKSKELNTAICGSIMFLKGKSLFNSFFFVQPNGDIDWYDKRHLFAMAGEDRVYSCGTQRKVIEYRGWRLFPIICYDLRFPVWCRNDCSYDAMICVANWPSPRISAWDILLASRAIENQAYVIGCNRTGKDSNYNHYPGHSKVINPFGDLTAVSENENTRIIPFSLQKKVIQNCRGKLPFLEDRDAFCIDISDR